MEINPVSKERFFGRKEILDTLEKRFEAFGRGYRHNIGLIGQPLVGKSSILAQFLRNRVQKEVIPIFIPLEEIDSFQAFSQKWLGSILYYYQRFLELPPTSSFQELLKQMRRKLPCVLKRMRVARKLASVRRYDQSFRELLNLPYILHQETGRKILLVIDEFDRLSHLPLNDPFAQLGKEIMLQKDTMYVVSSSSPTRGREIFKEKLSLLFSNFEVVEVRNFNFEEAEQGVRSRFKCPIQNSFLIQTLLYLTNGHPYYLDVLLSRWESISAARVGEVVTQSALIEAFELELFDVRGVLHRHFAMKIFAVAKNRFSSSCADVLLSVALNKKKVSSITSYLGKSTEEVKKILLRLIGEDLVQKRGSFFDISDSLFRLWLAEVYYRRRASFDFDGEADRLAFRLSLEKFFEFVARENGKDLPLRIEELFKRFKNEVIELGSSKVKCPRFTEVIAKPSNGRMFPVLAANPNTSWLCQVVKDRLREDDVRLFLEDLRKLSGPVHKKLMIILRGMELNAKLLAQEAKVQLWDLRDLNVLFDLYGQTKVIL